jgi:two-component system, cell cycle sensor histidine kinase and response regulator CckA
MYGRRKYHYRTAQEEMKAARGTASGTETILLVEDDEPLRKLTQTLLQENGYQVMESPDAASALKLAAGHEGAIHLLLSDVIMAQASGPELASKLRALRPEIKVLYMSGYTGRRSSGRKTIHA